MIPYTLMHATIEYKENTLSANITSASVFDFSFRIPSQLEDVLHLSIELLIDFTYSHIELTDYKIVEEKEHEFYYEYKIEVNDVHYTKLMQTFMKKEAEYVEAKNNDLVESLIDYPIEQDDEFYDTYDEMLKDMMSSFTIDKDYQQAIKDYSLALMLDNSEEYKKYLSMHHDDYRDDFFKRKYLSNHPLARLDNDYLYIGNSYCFFNMPSAYELTHLIEKAQEENKKIVFVLPPFKENQLDMAEELLGIIHHKVDEVAVNDVGMLAYLHKHYHFNIVLGILLNKYMKDPRIDYKVGDKKYLTQTGMMNDSIKTLLNDYDIEAMSLEATPNKVTLPIQYDLYAPMYVTNVSGHCIMYASCHNGNRAIQNEVKACPRYCLSQHILYPKHLKMLGKYNSLFAYELRALYDTEYLMKYKNVRRLVIAC